MAVLVGHPVAVLLASAECPEGALAVEAHPEHLAAVDMVAPAGAASEGEAAPSVAAADTVVAVDAVAAAADKPRQSGLSVRRMLLSFPRGFRNHPLTGPVANLGQEP